MKMITLQQALTQNKVTDFEQIGRKGRIYLSFNGKSGWSVRNFSGCLGIFQRVLRWLGFYSDTRLKHIAERMRKEAGVPEVLRAKINRCWNRRFPNYKVYVPNLSDI